MPELRVHRSPWRDFPDVIVQTPVNKLRSRAAYDKAKRGVGEAAFEVIKELFKPEKIQFDFDTVVPVMQFDRAYPNALPIAYAIALAKHFEADLELEILQANVVSHTAADAETRILGQPVYIGKLQRGSRILIVDDVITFGSTLANPRLDRNARCESCRCNDARRRFWRDQVGSSEIHAERLAKELGFTTDCFTNREARFLC